MEFVSLILLLCGADFPICTAHLSQDYASVHYVNNQYYVFWQDERFRLDEFTSAIFAARITSDGIVIDVDGKIIFNDSVFYGVDAAYDGTNFLVVFRNTC
jgi:hypothetical protein